MLQNTVPSSNTSVLEGLKLWIELLIAGVALLSGAIGYKVNQIIFKPGGLGDRMGKSEDDIIRLQERSSDNARRLDSLERDRWTRRDRS